ncbi:protein Mis18-beta [Tachysurus vachellii]|uniref:protein Mis18-beta n=1 Tax=Tachysurus vachellii TaxID=175792 RepID=UPI00296B0946|nr:protein Mis18-beta [Tachysurus vachellii]
MSQGNGLVSVLEPCDSSSQSSVIWTQLRDMEDTVERGVEYDKCSVFHCANVKCNLVLGDSLGACGELQGLRAIICLKICKDVRIRGKMEMSKEGPLKFCTYKALECPGCRGFVGLVLCSTPHHLSSLRGLFLLLKEAVSCYMLKSCTIVKASKLCFENRALGRTISEMKQDLEAQLKRVELLKDMMTDDSRLGHSHLSLSTTVSH